MDCDPHLNFDLNLPPSPFQHIPPLNILAWNVRGAANPDFRRVFINIAHSHKPDLVIITETRISGERASSIINTLGFDMHYKVDAMGFSGGIWMLWNPTTIQVNILASSFQEIHAHGKVQNFSFILTGLYASPIFNIRKNLWESLSIMSQALSYPWVLLGDFNDISNRDEKFGGLPPSQYKMNCFNNFLNISNLIDLGFEGPRFTWLNGREHHSLIRTRIDRVHANSSWLALFPNSKVFHLPRVKSDHCPILLQTNTHFLPIDKPFRLELFWINHPSFPNIVKDCWNVSDKCLDDILTDFKNNIVTWSKNTFENIHIKKKTLLKRIAGIQKALSYSHNPQLLLLEKQLQQDFTTILDLA